MEETPVSEKRYWFAGTVLQATQLALLVDILVRKVNRRADLQVPVPLQIIGFVNVGVGGAVSAVAAVV